MKNRKNIFRIILIAVLAMLTAGSIESEALFAPLPAGDVSPVHSVDGYELEQMLMISRHNIRSPFSGGDSLLSRATPHEWFAWTSEPGELSVKGGQLETAMGQFFRKYMEARNFIPKNWRPEKDEVRFYANSLQRTIATSRFFAAGLLPSANVEVEYHKAYGEVDPLFCPIVRYNSPEFEQQVRSEVNRMGGDEGMSGIWDGLKDSFSLLEELLDFKDSGFAKENDLTHIPLDGIELVLNAGQEPALAGTGLALASSAVDALKLQIYEEEDLDKALFGHKMTEDELRKICKIGDTTTAVCLGSRTLAMQVTNSMITEIREELLIPERKFTFLCGHDSTLISLVSALDIKEYELPETISCKAPIGGKMIFEKYLRDDGQEYIKLSMCYNTTDQLRKSIVPSMEHPPMSCELELNGLEKNEDGYYRFDDVIARCDEIISHAYDYCDVTEDAA